MRAVAVAVVVVLLLGACGRSEQEEQLLDVRDAVFGAAGVELPDDANHTFRHDVAPGRCGDTWTLGQDFRPRNFGLEVDPVPIEVAEDVAEFLEGPEGVEVVRYESRNLTAPTEVSDRAVDWTSGEQTGLMFFVHTVGYTFRVTMIEQCPEPRSVGRHRVLGSSGSRS